MTEQLRKLSPSERGVYYNHAEFTLDPNSPYRIHLLRAEEGTRFRPRITELGFILPYGSSAYLRLEWEDARAFMGLRYIKSHEQNPPLILGSLSNKRKRHKPDEKFEFTHENGLSFTLYPTDLSQVAFRRSGVPPIILNYTLGARAA